MSLIASEDALTRFALARGFQTAATACGLKKSGALDLALVWSDTPCTAAGVFTTNRVQAAPVLVDHATLKAAGSRIRGVLANAGCANAVTGERGLADAHRMQALGAEAIGSAPEQVLVLSTGVIGVFLDMDKVAAGVQALRGPAAQTAPHAVARAITTTDTVPKIAAQEFIVGGRTVRIAGFAKGAGMIHPNMATMLAVITTDVAIDAARLDDALTAAVARSFNRISVDGDMSTNDTVLVLANGASGAVIPSTGASGAVIPSTGASGAVIQETGADAMAAFTAALTDVCASLARQIARDGEGATRLVELRITGGASEAQAHRVGDSIACSPLVKTAIHGNDPNWGRILAAAGYSGEAVEPAKVRLWFGDGDAVQLLDRGLPVAFDRSQASGLLKLDPAVIHLDLGLGDAATVVWTCDFSAEYVSINADYTT